ncbi:MULTISPECIES: hypothetical protein [unclassified Microbacterium]|uniref:hypothetical protein n=1 Tax=unclassified Microbacterium TaxID=2609290 RepID=UPI00386F4120
MTGQEARDDEREALIRALRERSIWHSGAPYEEDADAILAALGPHRKHPEPEITEEMVERGARAIFAEEQCDRTQKATAEALVSNWQSRLSERDQAEYRALTRAALEAALRVPVGEGGAGSG